MLRTAATSSHQESMESTPASGPRVSPPGPATGATATLDGPARPPLSLEACKEIRGKVWDGAITPEELREAYGHFLASEASLKAELKPKGKDPLLRMLDPMTAYRFKGERKDVVIDMVVQKVARDFLPAMSYSYNPLAETSIQAIGRLIGEATPETIQGFAAEVAKGRAERRERLEGRLKALQDPVTLEDFQTFEKIKGRDALSPEQKVRYDELLAGKQREVPAVPAAPAVVEAVQVGDLGMELHASRHTKTNEPLWVVSLSQRVERGTYDELNGKAKALGGWYSSFRGNGAIPGFAFKTEDAAKRFMALRGGDVENPVAMEAPKPDKAERVSSKLLDMAERMREQAEEELGRTRKTHTHRYAAMASNAEREAKAKLAMAQTLVNLGSAIQAGRAKHLAGITSRAQIEEMDTILRLAVYDHARDRKDKGGEKVDWDALKTQAPTLEAVEFARYPYPRLSSGHWRLRQLQEGAAGAKGVARSMAAVMKLVDQASVKSEDAVFDTEGTLGLLQDLGGKLGPKPGAVIVEIMQPLRRLRAAGIETPVQLRTALREYLVYKAMAPGEDPIKAAERALIGVRIPGYIPTPEALALDVAEKADIQPGMRLLEPSAGKGSLLDAVRALHGEAVEIEAIEWNMALSAILEAKGYNVVGSDIFAHEGSYDRIVMNPPFEEGADMEHVQKAYSLLKPGGRLVAIVSEGPFFRSDRKAQEWRDWFEGLGGTSERNPEGSFKSSDRPTGVATRTIILDR